MKLIPSTACNSVFFDFQPQKKWPESWPPFAWDHKLITGFTQGGHHLVLEFNDKIMPEKCNYFLKLFHSCYPQLSLPELGRILSKWDIKQLPGFSWSDFFALYHYHQDFSFLKIFFTKLTATPTFFQNWVTEKKLHIGDLRILNTIPNINDLLFMFQWIAEKKVSHLHGVTALELAGELLLMGFKETDILNKNFWDNPQAMVQHIEQKRKVNTLSKDREQQKKLKSTTWPSQVHGQWVRRGDQSGLEIKLWCKSHGELQKKLKTLSNLDTLNKVFLNEE